jgi:hypothetical protein
MSNVQIPQQLSRWREKIESLSLQADAALVWINISVQSLQLYEAGQMIASYPVSTALKGTGCQQDSFQTPIGLHQISEKIGENEPAGMIFKGRQPTGEIAAIEQSDKDTGSDLITSRILWLDGMEPGLNRGNGVDTHDRYIYIHGTNEEGRLGQAVSHGCVRMKNSDVIDLFDRVAVGTTVVII